MKPVLTVRQVLTLGANSSGHSMARDTDLVFGDLFGPGQLDVEEMEKSELPIVLDLIKECEGEPSEFDDRVEELFLSDSDNPEDRKGNLRYGVGTESGYRLVDDDFEFTAIGEELYDLRNDEEALYERFAKYILLECDGLKVLEAIDDMHASGVRPSLRNISEALEEQYDIYTHSSNTDLSQMRAWLNKADILGTGRDYSINWEAVEDLVGVDSEGMLELSELTTEQRAFLRALARIDPAEPVPNSTVREIAENAYGVDINQKSIVTDILDPLSEFEYIEYVNPSDVSGKANLVIPTDKFENDVLLPLLETVSERTEIPRRILRSNFEEIREQMESDSTHEKGLALEVLAVKIGRLLGLQFEGWHIRGRATGGAEVDVVMDATDVSFSRWQIQCKNISKPLNTGHVKEEVGVARMLQSNVILMVTSSSVAPDARRFASRVMFRSNLSIMFIEGDELEEFDDDDPSELLNTLRRETRRVERLKQLTENDMVEAPDEEESETSEEEVFEEYKEDLEEYLETEEEEDHPKISEFTDPADDSD